MSRRPFFFTIDFMARGTGDESGGQAIRTTKETSDITSRVIDLVDSGQRVFLDARAGNQKKALWQNLASSENLSLVEISDNDHDLRERLQEALSSPAVVVFHSQERPQSDVEDFLADLANKDETSDFSGKSYQKNEKAILFIDDKKGYYKKPPKWLKNKDLYLADDLVFYLTTEELGLLATGKRLTLSKDDRVFRIHADDLDCAVRDLAEGRLARAGNVVLEYS